jgi:hypothetical protein
MSRLKPRPTKLICRQVPAPSNQNDFSRLREDLVRFVGRAFRHDKRILLASGVSTPESGNADISSTC